MTKFVKKFKTEADYQAYASSEDYLEPHVSKVAVGSIPHYNKNVFNGHDYVDLGLPSGLLWATCNVGASSPEEYGNYYAWGETKPKSAYTWDTYKYGTSSNDSDITKYNPTDEKTVLEPEDDAAHANMGGEWRMPTYAELSHLTANTTSTWETLNGVNGRRFTGPNGNSIFIPAAGCYGDSIGSVGAECEVLASDRSVGNGACYATFKLDCLPINVGLYTHSRHMGISVRGVISR